MRNLIERLEKATGPDRAIDWEIAIKIGIVEIRLNGDTDYAYIVASNTYLGSEGQYKWRDLPAYTASLDAALMLVPKGKDWRVGNMTGLPTATVCTPGAWLSFKTAPTAWHGETPALALCIAALKARESSK